VRERYIHPKIMVYRLAMYYAPPPQYVASVALHSCFATYDLLDAPYISSKTRMSAVPWGIAKEDSAYSKLTLGRRLVLLCEKDTDQETSNNALLSRHTCVPILFEMPVLSYIACLLFIFLSIIFFVFTN
jgi:hypothetical protein